MDPFSTHEGLSFDLKAVIDQTGLDLDEYLEIYELFQENFDELVTELETALENKDSENIMRAAHTLKGSTSNIGFVALSEMAKEIQNAPEDLELVATMLPQIKSQYMKLNDEVQTIAQMQ